MDLDLTDLDLTSLVPRGFVCWCARPPPKTTYEAHRGTLVTDGLWTARRFILTADPTMTGLEPSKEPVVFCGSQAQAILTTLPWFVPAAQGADAFGRIIVIAGNSSILETTTYGQWKWNLDKYLDDTWSFTLRAFSAAHEYTTADAFVMVAGKYYVQGVISR